VEIKKGKRKGRVVALPLLLRMISVKVNSWRKGIN
tara:strand:+ start:977 stop:1081 length:105 start_codon:yes stop_codon:yes gene_type:complete